MNDLKFQCPVCGAALHPNSRGCGKCGARREGKRWIQPEAYDGLDLPGNEDDDFDYDEFVRQEFGDGPGRKRSGKEIFWWIVGILTLVAFSLVYAFG